MPNDIPETIRRTVSNVAAIGAKLLSFSGNISEATIDAAIEARGSKEYPKFLLVPQLSSEYDRLVFSPDIANKVDGFVTSGDTNITGTRRIFPKAVIVGVGIRPVGDSEDDHKRVLTPAEAIEYGADYIVVGRPIRDATNRRQVVQSILASIS